MPGSRSYYDTRALRLKRRENAQRIFGLSALILAIAGIFYQTAVHGLIIGATIFAAFSCGRGALLGYVAIMANLVNMLLVSPKIWFPATGLLAGDMERHGLISVGLAVIVVQVATAVFLYVFSARKRSARLEPDEALRRRDFSRR